MRLGLKFRKTINEFKYTYTHPFSTLTKRCNGNIFYTNFATI